LKYFLLGFYEFAKTLVKTMFRIFYSKSVVINQEQLDFKNPCIAISNHPSTLTDPLHVAKNIRKQVFFLANAGLFKSAIGGWFFNTFYCIPVERPKDVAGRRIQNDKAFERCDQHLGQGGCLYIAAQGYSQMVRRLGHPLKTGTARIALSAESNNNFNLGLTIVPVGLSYSHPTDFRTGIIINAGEHLKVADYKTAYANDPIKTVRQLTKDLEDRLRTLLIETDDEEEELLIVRMEKIVHAKAPLQLEENFLRTQKLARQFRQLKTTESIHYQQLKTKTTEHFEQLDKLAVTPRAVFAKANSFTDLLTLIIGLPFFLYGWINNFIPNFIPAFLVKIINIYAGYASTIKLMSALLIYPIFYGIQICLVQYFFSNKWITLAYVISLPIFGLLAWAYRKKYIRFKEVMHWNKKRKEHESETDQILDRQEVLAEELGRLA